MAKLNLAELNKAVVFAEGLHDICGQASRETIPWDIHEKAAELESRLKEHLRESLAALEVDEGSAT